MDGWYRGWRVEGHETKEGWWGCAGDPENPGYLRSDGIHFDTRAALLQWLKRQVDLVIARDSEEAQGGP